MGGGQTSTTTNTMDPVYAAAAADATRSSQAMSEDMWNMAKPYYQQQLDFTADTMTPYYQNLYQSSQALLPAQTELSQAQIQDSLGDIQRNQQVKDTLAQEQLKELNESSPVREEFYKQALKGVDPDYEQVMGKAAADAEQSYANAEGSIRRNLQRTGLGPDSGAYASAMANQEFAKANAKALARSNAYMTEKKNVQDTNFNRLAAATQTAGRASGLAGVSDASQASSTTRNLAASSGTNPYTSSGAQDGVNTALSGVTNAANTWVNMGKANSTSTQTTSGGGIGSVLGPVAGAGTGALASWGLSFLP